jgi:hypothetical protein
MGVVKARVGNALVKACLAGMVRSQRFHSVDDLRALLPDVEPEELRTWKMADLTQNTTVRLRRSSFFAGDPTARTQFLGMLVQGGPLVIQHMDADQLSELLNYRDELGPSELDRQRELAEAENARLRRGELQILGSEGKFITASFEGVMDTDNDVEHIKVHRRTLADPQRHLLDPGFKNRLLLHIKQHEANLMKKGIANAQQAMLAQVAAQGGGQPPAREPVAPRGPEPSGQARAR